MITMRLINQAAFLTYLIRMELLEIPGPTRAPGVTIYHLASPNTTNALPSP